ncbi:unnamed protein product [Amoebophrya sp. A120]|nr:unnamed protein product [Amoebophrya sp. A120]|eukprot:GSA120T00008017001.1
MIKVNVKKNSEKDLVERIRAFQRSTENGSRKCADCTQMGPTYVCFLGEDYRVFVCTSCSGVHRELNHKVKGISVSKWTPEEVDDIVSKGGNQRAAGYFSAEWNPRDYPEPDSGDTAKIREFIRLKYKDRRWIPRGPSHHSSNRGSYNNSTPAHASRTTGKSPRSSPSKNRQGGQVVDDFDPNGNFGSNTGGNNDADFGFFPSDNNPPPQQTNTKSTSSSGPGFNPNSRTPSKQKKVGGGGGGDFMDDLLSMDMSSAQPQPPVGMMMQQPPPPPSAPFPGGGNNAVLGMNNSNANASNFNAINNMMGMNMNTPATSSTSGMNNNMNNAAMGSMNMMGMSTGMQNNPMAGGMANMGNNMMAQNNMQQNQNNPMGNMGFGGTPQPPPPPPSNMMQQQQQSSNMSAMNNMNMMQSAPGFPQQQQPGFPQQQQATPSAGGFGFPQSSPMQQQQPQQQQTMPGATSMGGAGSMSAMQQMHTTPQMGGAGGGAMMQMQPQQRSSPQQLTSSEPMIGQGAMNMGGMMQQPQMAAGAQQQFQQPAMSAYGSTAATSTPTLQFPLGGQAASGGLPAGFGGMPGVGGPQAVMKSPSSKGTTATVGGATSSSSLAGGEDVFAGLMAANASILPARDFTRIRNPYSGMFQDPAIQSGNPFETISVPSLTEDAVKLLSADQCRELSARMTQQMQQLQEHIQMQQEQLAKQMKNNPFVQQPGGGQAGQGTTSGSSANKLSPGAGLGAMGVPGNTGMNPFLEAASAAPQQTGGGGGNPFLDMGGPPNSIATNTGGAAAAANSMGNPFDLFS